MEQKTWRQKHGRIVTAVAIFLALILSAKLIQTAVVTAQENHEYQKNINSAKQLLTDVDDMTNKIQEYTESIPNLEVQIDVALGESRELTKYICTMYAPQRLAEDGIICPNYPEVDTGSQLSTPTGQRTPASMNPDDSYILPTLTDSGTHQRWKEFMIDYNLDPSQWREVASKYQINNVFTGCVAFAETTMGTNGAGLKNIFNLGANDRGDRPVYESLQRQLEYFGQTLHNQYLGKTKTIACLNNAGNCGTDQGNRYATSNKDGHRETNVLRCMSNIYQEEISPHFLFREGITHP